MHRFYIGDESLIDDLLTIKNRELLWQWNKVLRFRAQDKLVLFNGNLIDYAYQIVEISPKHALLKQRGKQKNCSVKSKNLLILVAAKAGQ